MLFNKVSFALTALLSSTVVMMSGCTTSPSGTASNTQQQAQNALLVYGGHILTMQGMQPRERRRTVRRARSLRVRGHRRVAQGT